jgi:hypothetical protein
MFIFVVIAGVLQVVDARVGGGCKVPGSRSRKFGRMTQRAVGGHFDSGWNDYGN